MMIFPKHFNNIFEKILLKILLFLAKILLFFWKNIDIFGQHQNYRHYFNNIEIFLLMRSHYE